MWQRYAIKHLRRRSQGMLARPAIPLTALQVAARDIALGRFDDGQYTFQDAACLCGTTDGEVVTDRDRYGLPATNVICAACGIVRATPRLRDTDLTLFYENDYRPLYAGASSPSDAFFQSRIEMGRRLLAYVTGLVPAGGKIADVGAGSGGLLIPLHDAGYSVVGCDVGGDFLERGRNLGLDLRHGSYETLANDGPFDLIVVSHVLEHVAEPAPFLTGLRELAKGDGKLYVELPGLRAVARDYGDPLRYFQNAHLWNFDLDSLSRTLSETGWSFVKGDEYIRALFVAGAARRVPGSSYASNLRALARAERLRHVNEIARRTRAHLVASRIRPIIAAVRSRLGVSA